VDGIAVERVYDMTEPPAGAAFLVDRIWPRGVTKERLAAAEWLRDVAPSPELRTWFGHDPARWPEFRRRYRAELDQKGDALKPIIDAAREGPVTLLYGARDTEHNNAIVLRDYVDERLRT
jgi:uncharacterized protein YeaO (DUF488 family)